MNVLIFDSDPGAGRTARTIATEAGLAADIVCDAAGFLRRLRDDPPGAVVLDLLLDDTDGVEQLRRLAESRYQGAVVLLGRSHVRLLETARALGEKLGLTIAATLEKPLDAAAFRQVLERLTHVTRAPSNDRLMAAIAADELTLHFQPIVSRHPPALRKLEALVRWDHALLGRLPPASFIPMAETDPAVMDALTGWVIRRVVSTWRTLSGLGVAVPVSVNISARNLDDLAFPDRVAELLREGGMPADQLCLEISDSASVSDAPRTLDVLSRIRLKGMHLSLDDFGTGHGSLQTLRQMPFSEVKIDRSFIADVATSASARGVAQSIIGLAGSLGVTCVAEGVETEAAAAILDSLGPCLQQGHAIGAPLPSGSVAAWLARWVAEGVAGVEPAAPPVAADVVEPAPALADDAPVPCSGWNVRLSPRQTDVMMLLAKGFSIKQIASTMKLGVGTVKIHIASAYAALGTRNRVEALTRLGALRHPGGMADRPMA